MAELKGIARRGKTLFFVSLFGMLLTSWELAGQSLDFPSKRWGISFGNSKEFTGLRFNFRDEQVRRITGVNITFWQPKKDNKESVVTGISLGLIPGGAYMKGLNLGILGPGATTSMTGLNLGLIGVGAGEDLNGINIGGLGIGSGENMTGLNLGGLGAGAGENVAGISIGGIGVGAGKNMTGVNIGGLGVGAGERLTGINIGGLGVGAGESLVGLTVAGIGAGSDEVWGLTVAGLGVGGKILKGVHLAGAMVRVENGGRMVGLAVSAVNYFKGTQKGLAIGIVNYAWSLKGVQIGLVNIVRDNPKYSRILPIINANF
jgi:hypothetical protein